MTYYKSRETLDSICYPMHYESIYFHFMSALSTVVFKQTYVSCEVIANRTDILLMDHCHEAAISTVY